MALLSKTVSQLFLSKKIQDEVDLTHKHVLIDEVTLPLKGGRQHCVMHYMACPQFEGFTITLDDEDSLRKRIQQALLGTEPVRWNQFSMRAGPETRMMEARHDFLKGLAPHDLKLLQDPNAPFEEINRITWYAHTPTILLPFKAWLLLNGGEFTGVLPTTSPVLEALKYFWQIKKVYGKTMREQSAFQHALAKELGIDSNRLNTTLWVLGQNILEEAKEIEKETGGV